MIFLFLCRGTELSSLRMMEWVFQKSHLTTILFDRKIKKQNLKIVRSLVLRVLRTLGKRLTHEVGSGRGLLQVSY